MWNLGKCQKITHDKSCKIMEKKKIKIRKIVLFLGNKILDPDQHQLEKWDPDPYPHQNVLDPPHCSKPIFHVLFSTFKFH